MITDLALAYLKVAGQILFVKSMVVDLNFRKSPKVVRHQHDWN